MPEYKVLFFSDPHILYPNSRLKDGFRPETAEDFAKYDFVVCGGDTFDLHYFFHLVVNDFKKHHLLTDLVRDMGGEDKLEPELKLRLRAAIRRAVEIFEDLLSKLHHHNPETVFLNLMGNHDNITRFAHDMDGLQSSRQNFRWHPEFYKISDGLFTHGDTVLRRQDIENREVLKPRSYADAWIRLEVERLLHNFIQLTWFYAWNSPTLLIPRFSDRLQEQKNISEHLGEIRHCFFGHVHVDPFHNGEFNGIKYHQTGSAIIHRHCKPLEIVIKSESGDKSLSGKEGNFLFNDGKITSVEPAQIRGLSHQARWTDLISPSFLGISERTR